MICIHCEHQFIGGAFIRSSGPGTSVAMRRCPKCEREFVAPPKPRAPGKVVALQAEVDTLRATVERMTTALRDIRWHAKHGDAYAAETCGKLANDALDGVKP